MEFQARNVTRNVVLHPLSVHLIHAGSWLSLDTEAPLLANSKPWEVWCGVDAQEGQQSVQTLP